MVNGFFYVSHIFMEKSLLEKIFERKEMQSAFSGAGKAN